MKNSSCTKPQHYMPWKQLAYYIGKAPITISAMTSMSDDDMINTEKADNLKYWKNGEIEYGIRSWTAGGV